MADWRGANGGGDGQLRDVFSALRGKDQELERQRSQIELLTRRAALAENEKKQAQRQVEEAKGAVAERGRQTSRLAENIDALKAQVELLTAGQRSRENTLAAAETTIANLRAAAAADRARYAAALAEVNAAYSARLSGGGGGGGDGGGGGGGSGADAEAARARGDAAEARAGALQAALAAAQEEAAAARSAAAQAQADAEELLAQVAEAVAAGAAATAAAAAAAAGPDAEKEALKAQLAQASVAKTAVEKELATLRDFNGQMEDYATSLEQRIAEMQVRMLSEREQLQLLKFEMYALSHIIWKHALRRPSASSCCSSSTVAVSKAEPKAAAPRTRNCNSRVMTAAGHTQRAVTAGGCTLAQKCSADDKGACGLASMTRTLPLTLPLTRSHAMRELEGG
ncbi:hypothetical protein JKP88DRAFT_322322 [Tribonema minus]|uniref:Uncharacterized protein n=1 Tax=Tribonema minus TaxID=303371 RepID=A0A836CD15_9STRA|nr:hypothetical protein JKP88DRAFT_322322 [Tribonema minus]